MTLCTRCKRVEAVSGGTRCQACRDHTQAQERARRALNRSHGLCACGKTLVPGRKSCQACLDRGSAKNAVRSENWRIDGLCPRCGREPAPGRVHCDWHLALGRAYWLEMDHETRERIRKRDRDRKRGKPRKHDPNSANRVRQCKARWREQGRCVVCGVVAPINPLTGKHYHKCTKHLLMDNRKARNKYKRKSV